MGKSKLKIKRTDSSMFNSSRGEQQKKKKEEWKRGDVKIKKRQSSFDDRFLGSIIICSVLSDESVKKILISI